MTKEVSIKYQIVDGYFNGERSVVIRLENDVYFGSDFIAVGYTTGDFSGAADVLKIPYCDVVTEQKSLDCFEEIP